MSTTKDVEITRWILDTRNLWTGTKIVDAASKYLNLLPKVEQDPILRKYHFNDAAISLGSALLKRAYIAKSTGLPWASITFTRKLDNRLGKPLWQPPHYGKDWPVIDFNVSHQKGLVLLVGICQPPASPAAEISTDLVAPNERNDFASIAGSSFEAFIDTFSDLFSADELFALTWTLPKTGHITLPDGSKLSIEELGRLDRTIHTGETLQTKAINGKMVSFLSDLIIEEKIRCFYTAFSLKEAYVKLGGEGIGAVWIKQCEFHNVRAPIQGGIPEGSRAGVFGEKIANTGEEEAGVEVTMDQKEVTNVAVEVQAYEADYLFATMLRPKTLVGHEFPAWQIVQLDDVLPSTL